MEFEKIYESKIIERGKKYYNRNLRCLFLSPTGTTISMPLLTVLYECMVGSDAGCKSINHPVSSRSGYPLLLKI